MCTSFKSVNLVDEDDSDDIFLGSVEGEKSRKKWTVKLKIGHTTAHFKIDTGVDCSVIGENVYRK